MSAEEIPTCSFNTISADIERSDPTPMMPYHHFRGAPVRIHPIRQTTSEKEVSIAIRVTSTKNPNRCFFEKNSKKSCARIQFLLLLPEKYCASDNPGILHYGISVRYQGKIWIAVTILPLRQMSLQRILPPYNGLTGRRANVYRYTGKPGLRLTIQPRPLPPGLLFPKP